MAINRILEQTFFGIVRFRHTSYLESFVSRSRVSFSGDRTISTNPSSPPNPEESSNGRKYAGISAQAIRVSSPSTQFQSGRGAGASIRFDNHTRPPLLQVLSMSAAIWNFQTLRVSVPKGITGQREARFRLM